MTRRTALVHSAIVAIAVIVAASVARGQDAGAAADRNAPAAATGWEAVSIKPVSEVPGLGPGPAGADLFSRSFITLHQLLIYAYELPAYRIVGGSSWVTADHYAVLGKMSGPAQPGEMRALVRGLLTDRFGLTFHREKREMPVYDLELARSDRRPGPRLKPATVDCMPFLTGQRPRSESPLMDVPEVGPRPRCAVSLTFNRITGLTTPQLNGVTIARFAEYLQQTTNRTVRDQTALSGVFDIELTFADENTPSFAGLERTAPPEGSSLSTALNEQLGLKLQPARAVEDVLVIDAASRPTPN